MLGQAFYNYCRGEGGGGGKGGGGGGEGPNKVSSLKLSHKPLTTTQSLIVNR